MKKKIILAAVAVIIITLTLVFLSINNKSAKKAETAIVAPNNTASGSQSGLGTTSNQSQMSDAASSFSNSTDSTDGRSDTSLADDNGLASEILKLTLSDSASIFSELPKKFSAVKNDTLTKIELVDENNQAITLDVTNYLIKSGVIHGPSGLSNSSKVTMYVFKKSSDYGPSEAILIENSKTSLENKEMMQRWETSLVDDAKAFALIGEKYDLIKASSNKTFSWSGLYRDCRFVNITKDKAITLNYYYGDKKIILANSLSIFETLAKKMGVLIDYHK